MISDRLALATRVKKARRASICGVCRTPILVNMTIARVINPGGWIHVRCVGAVRDTMNKIRRST